MEWTSGVLEITETSSVDTFEITFSKFEHNIAGGRFRADFRWATGP